MSPRLIFLLTALYCSMASIADPGPVKYLGIEHGLTNNAVTCIYQDYNGFLWFGTYDGLNRYDGYGFKTFRNVLGDSTSLSGNHIYSIADDAHHNIWIGTVKGISIYDPARSEFTTPQYIEWKTNLVYPLRDGSTSVKHIPGKGMLVGTQSTGLMFFENNSHIGIQIPLYGKQGSYHVSSIELDPSGRHAWVFVNHVGLYIYTIQDRSLRPVNNSIKQAYSLKIADDRHLWLGNENGLYIFNFLSNSFSENFFTSKTKVMDIEEDRHGTLWIASDGNGVWTLPAASSRPAPYLSGTGSSLVNSNAVYDIYEDRDGRKWIGTLRGGVNIVEPATSSFRHITYNMPEQNNIINNFILSFCEDGKNVWIGTDGAGLRYWDREKNTFSSYVHNDLDNRSISSNFITAITKDSRNDIWIGTWFGGINRLSRSSSSFDRYTCINPRREQEENNIWVIYEDAQQRLWASATNDGSLYLLDRTANKFKLFDENILNLQCIREDRSGNFWGGNYTSLILIDRINKKHKTYPIGYPVRFIHEDASNNFWIGTEGAGLLLFNRSNGTFTQFSTSDGLPGNTILRILEDRNNKLWLSTYNGICRFDPVNKTFRNYSQSDGLQSNQFSFNAGLALSSGEFLFGGIKGFNIFFPDSIYDRKKMPGIFLTGLTIDNKAVEEDDSYVTKRDKEIIKEITLPFSRAIVSIDFTALEYAAADKIKYAYYLDGWDKGWTYVNNIRTANYSRLQEGSYTFRIKVANADGVWDGETQLLKIVVLPPWYRTWWAYLIYILTGCAGVYLYVLYNKRQERLRFEIKLALLKNEKEKELTEKKIAFFTQVSHEFRTPLTLIINPLKEIMSGKADIHGRKDISMIYRNARRLLSLVDQLLLFRQVESIDQDMRIERFDMVEICNEVFLSFGQHALSKNIDFSFVKNEQPVSIYADKEKIEIILFNLVANAFKYTNPGGSISLRLLENENDIVISVKDTGCGIPEEAGSKLFDSFYQASNKDKASQTGFGVGLYVSQKLALAHQGHLSYTSEQGRGTEFRLFLLKGKKHFASRYVSEDYKTNTTILQELVEEPVTENFLPEADPVKGAKTEVIDRLTSQLPAMVIVDDNAEIRSYIRRIFEESFIIYEADDGETGFAMVKKQTPDIVISDIMMRNISGIELCQRIKDTSSLAHIPVVLLTASSSDEIKLKGIEGGAEDYITKPFDREIIQARVRTIMKGRNRLQQYFFDAVTLKPDFNIPGEHKEFIERCMAIVDKHLDDPSFSIPTFCKEIGMSHPSLYKKVKSVSGLTVNVFIRYLRLRKAAELLINTNKTIVEVTYITGFNDIRYFREQFHKLFDMNPSEYVKRYRKVLSSRDAKPAE